MGVFCDWLSISQQHPLDSCPDLNAGRVVRLVKESAEYERKFTIIDEDGVIWTEGSVEYTTAHAMEHEGSYDTSIQVKCENGYVKLSGNVGRLNRPDNMFGYSVEECVQIANRIVVSLGLPPFADLANVPLWKGKSAKRGDDYYRAEIDAGHGVSGASITRVDLTRNYTVGSRENAAKLIHYISTLNRINKPGKYYGESGVTWGEGSKFWYAKLYAKYIEMKKEKAPARELEYAMEQGLLRDEISLKSKYLARFNLRSIASWKKGNDMENVIYGRFDSIFKASEISSDPYESIPGRLGELAVMWRNGADLRSRMSQATFYRYRKKLKNYGIDISKRCDVSTLNFRTTVIEMAVVDAPDWYSLPQAA